MKVFIAYSLERSHLKELEERLACISAGATDAGYSAYAHVRDGQNWILGEMPIPDMMIKVFNEIKSSDVVLLDLTSNNKSKRTGLNIELGYALAQEKPIVALYRLGDRPNMTTDMARIVASYESITEIRSLVGQLLRAL